MTNRLQPLGALIAAAIVLAASACASRSQESVEISYYYRKCTTDQAVNSVLEACNEGIEAAKSCRAPACTLYNSEGGADDRAIAAMHVRRGRVHDQLRQYNRALADFEAAVALDPANVTALQLRGFERVGIGFLSGDGTMLDQGVADLKVVIARTPSDVKAHYFLGAAAFANHDAPGALSYLETALALDPVDYDALYMRGMVRVVLGQSQAALADFNRAIKIAPGKSLAYIGRATLNYFVVRDYKNALVDFARGAWIKLDRGLQALIVIGAIGAFPLLLVRQFGRRHGVRPTLVALTGGAGGVAARLALRWRALLVSGLVLFLLSAGVAQFSDRADEGWKSFWNTLGITTFLVPGSGGAILGYLVLQAFAVRAHQITAVKDPRSLAAFWYAYVRFTAYATALFFIGYIGIVLPAVIGLEARGAMMEHVAGIPVFWIVLLAVAGACVLVLSIIGGCSLMLPAAAMGHPLSPRAAFHLARDKSWRLNWTMTGFTLLCALLGWLLDQGLLLMSEDALREGGRGLTTLLAAYLAVALNATALSLFYAEVTETR